MLVYLIIMLAVIARFIPHMANAAPITAIAIFTAAYLPKKQAVGTTLAARLISDLFLGFFSLPLMIAVYAAHLAGIIFGFWIKQSTGKSSRWSKIVASGLFSAVLFFLITNFALFYSEYTHNLSGILSAYINGLPFLRGTLFGDLGYTVALFGAYELIRYAVTRRNQKQVVVAS